MDGDQVPRPSADIADWVREVAATQDPRVGTTTPVVPLLTRGLPTRPVANTAAQVYICAGVIVKIHTARTDHAALARRMHCIGGPDIDRYWIQPLVYGPLKAPGGRLGSIWPRVSVLATIDRPPWAAAGTLLARMHSVPISDNPPAHGGPARLQRAIDQLREGPARLQWVADLGVQVLEALATPGTQYWVHGDFHLGQLGHTPLRSSWKLLDVDDFGIGDPAWDLARPAGFWAAGLLGDDAWTEFVDAYREAGGPAIPATGDPWVALDLPAQAAIIVATVQQFRTHHDDIADQLLRTCHRIAG